MSDDFGKKFKMSMDDIHFSSADKERMYKRLFEAECREKSKEKGRQQTPRTDSETCFNMKESGETIMKESGETIMKESEDIIMKKWRYGKVAAVAALCFMLTGVTVFAASKTIYYIASSGSGYDYKDAAEMTQAQSDLQGENGSRMPEFPETFKNGFSFKGGDTVHNEGKDESGNTTEEWTDLSADYKDSEGRVVELMMQKAELMEETEPTKTRMIDGVKVMYYYDEYLFIPIGYELDEAVKERMETDSHFYVSEGSDEPETEFYSTVSFEKDGIAYMLSTYDDVEGDDLFDMAKELIER